MDARVKEFLDAAKAAERKRFETERDSLLLSLGLVDPDRTRRKYSDYYSSTYPDWDAEKKKYYRDVPEPIVVSDEEYEEIKKYAPKDAKKVGVGEKIIANGDEKFLSVINSLVLIIGVIASIPLFVIALSTSRDILNMLSPVVVLLTTLVSWAVVKVVLNVSNNLHEINSKIN